MNVLVVCDVLGKENNGTTIAAMNLIRYLKSQGENVYILCADQDKKENENTFVVPNIYLGAIINHILKKNNVNLAKPVKKIINKALDNIDVVHIMIPFALGNATCRLAKKRNIPVVAGFHCQAENFTSHLFHSMNCKWFNKLVYKVFYKKLYSKVNAIHYPTKFIQETFESVIKRKTNGYVISNGVNDRFMKIEVEKPDNLKDKFVILFIGRLSKEKSHKILVKAISKSKYKEKIQLVFAGQGPKEKEVLKLAKKLKINKPIIDFYSRDELVKIINYSDLYVHPAEIEIEAIACLEAITCGLVPVISSSPRSATNAFAFSNKNLFENNNYIDLANRIDYWIENEDEKKKCSNDYLGYTSQFKQNECMKKMHNMLKTYAKKENHTSKKIYYYKDELNDDFANNGIKAKKIPSNYRYLHKCPVYKFIEFIVYFIIAKPIVFFLNKIVYSQKFINNLTVKKSKIGGCFIYSNHTLSMGDAYTPNLIFAKKNSIIVGPEAFSVPGIKTIIAMLGGIPLPNNLETTKNFLKVIEYNVNKKRNITIYPEAHIWPYYTKIRPFKDASFKYPIMYNKPVICITNTYIKKRKKVKLVTYLDGPFYPKDYKTKEELRNAVYYKMVERSSFLNQHEKYKYIDLKEIEEK